MTLLDLIAELAHDAYTTATWVFTGLTLFLVGLALYRLVPRRHRDLLPPDHDRNA